MSSYYNEIDPFCCAWLSNLMDAGMITPGTIDNRSIEDVIPAEVAGFDRVHFFAGIGIWDYALTRAGWTGPAWTGSCPCQPFSQAGQSGGVADERHLWPAFFHLIDECRPPVVLGEQVASKDGLGWLDIVSTDLEGAGYACGSVDLCACGLGAPHIRQRLWFVGLADADCGERDGFAGGKGRERDGAASGRQQGYGKSERRWEAGELADADSSGRLARVVAATGARHGRSFIADGRGDRPGPTNGVWRDADWLLCRDGKWRPAQSEIFPLAPAGTYRNRVAELRGAGNAICAPVAQAFIEAVMAARAA